MTTKRALEARYRQLKIWCDDMENDAHLNENITDAQVREMARHRGEMQTIRCTLAALSDTPTRAELTTAIKGALAALSQQATYQADIDYAKKILEEVAK